MWELFVWVPTKGWKLIRKYQAANRVKAIKEADTFQPLEVKLVSPSGRSYYGGIAHIALENVDSNGHIDRLVGEVEMEQASLEPTPLG